MSTPATNLRAEITNYEVQATTNITPRSQSTPPGLTSHSSITQHPDTAPPQDPVPNANKTKMNCCYKIVAWILYVLSCSLINIYPKNETNSDPDQPQQRTETTPSETLTPFAQTQEEGTVLPTSIATRTTEQVVIETDTATTTLESPPNLTQLPASTARREVQPPAPQSTTTTQAPTSTVRREAPATTELPTITPSTSALPTYRQPQQPETTKRRETRSTSRVVQPTGKKVPAGSSYVVKKTSQTGSSVTSQPSQTKIKSLFDDLDDSSQSNYSRRLMTGNKAPSEVVKEIPASSTVLGDPNPVFSEVSRAKSPSQQRLENDIAKRERQESKKLSELNQKEPEEGQEVVNEFPDLDN